MAGLRPTPRLRSPWTAHARWKLLYTIVLDNTIYPPYTTGAHDAEGSNALPPINTEIIIEGNGAVIERDPSLSCPGLNGGNFRLFFVDTDGALTLDNLTVRHGCEARGGGIYSSGVLTLTHVHLVENTAYSSVPFDAMGGGLYHAGGPLTILDSVIADNAARSGGESPPFSSGRGGGLYTDIFSSGGVEVNGIDEPSVIISGTTISGNIAEGSGWDSGHGGGIYHEFGALDIVNSEIVSNTARGEDEASGRGGGLFAGSPESSGRSLEFNENDVSGMEVFTPLVVTITDSTISGNRAEGVGEISGWGGGVFHAFGLLEIANSQVLSNTAHGDGPFSGLGGGMSQIGSAAEITDSVIAYNTARNDSDEMAIPQDVQSESESGGFGGWGGGLMVAFSSAVTVTHTHITHNRALGQIEESGWGGGMATTFFGQVTAQEIVLAHNVASNSGGALISEVLGILDSGEASASDIEESPVLVANSCIVFNSDTAVYNAWESDILARTNWWGAPDGPGGAGPGFGDSVSEGVDFADWLTAPPAICPALYIPTTLAVTKSVAPAGPLLPGQPLTYTLRYTNTGDQPAYGARLTDTVPAALTSVSFSANPAVADAGVTPPYVFDLGDVSPDASGSIVVTGRVNETLTANLTLSNQAVAAANNAAAVNSQLVANPVNLPALNFSQAAYSVDEAGGSASITVALAPVNPYAPVSVTVATQDGSALAGTDYTAVAQTLVFPPGVAQQSFSVPILDNDVADGDRSLSLLLQNAVNATAGPPATLTIVDDDLAGVLIDGDNLVVSEDGATDVFTVSLQSQPTAGVTLTILVDDPDACTVTPPSVVIDPAQWQQPQVFTVGAVDNEIVDGDRNCALTVVASSDDPHYENPQAGTVHVTVLDNDALGVQAVGDNETGTATYSLVSRPTAPVHLQITPENPDICHVEPGQITIAPDDWQTGAAVRVTAVSEDGEPVDCVLLATATSDDPNYNGADVPPVTITVPAPQTPGLVFTVGLSEQGGNPCQDAPAALTVQAGTHVVFCFMAQNAGSARLINHTLTGNLTGPIAIQEDLVLEPGASYSHTLTRTVTVSETHTFVWHAQAEPTAQPEGEVTAAQAVGVTREAQAIVEVQRPTNLPPGQQPASHLRHLFIPSVTQD